MTTACDQGCESAHEIWLITFRGKDGLLPAGKWQAKKTGIVDIEVIASGGRTGRDVECDRFGQIEEARLLVPRDKRSSS